MAVSAELPNDYNDRFATKLEHGPKIARRDREGG
jgi:hypothetical protein